MTTSRHFQTESPENSFLMIVYLSLGANLGKREETIDKAVELLTAQVGPLIRRSSFFYSKPWGFESEHDFCNICASFDTALAPTSLLHITQQIEKELGRMKKSQNGNYSDRLIDIDILLYGDLIIDTPELTIPHKNMQERDFVMVPLHEIAPDLPVFSKK